MKKILLLLFFGIQIHATAQSWIAQESGTVNDLHDVFCISPDIVVAVGDFGTILKTVDGGTNWITKSSGTNSHLSKVQFPDAYTGYAIGSDGKLLKTYDTAETWTSIYSTAASITDLSCLSENAFFIIENGILKKSIDGGNTFITVNPTQILEKIQFLDHQKGFASDSENFLKTTDGGITWSIAKQGIVQSFFFINDTTGFVYSIQNGNFKTTDGVNFSAIGFPSTIAQDIFALSENVVWEVNGLFALCGCPPEFCITKRSFVPDIESIQVSNCALSGNPDFTLNAVHFANVTTGFAVGSMGYQNPMNPFGPKGAIYKNTTGEMEPQSVQENKKEIVKLFPNPASDQLNIVFPENPHQSFTISISDYLGKLIISKRDMPKLDLSNWASGVYFAKIETNNGVSVQKFIRK